MFWAGLAIGIAVGLALALLALGLLSASGTVVERKDLRRQQRGQWPYDR